MKRWILIGMVVASGMTIQAQNKLPEKFPGYKFNCKRTSG